MCVIHHKQMNYCSFVYGGRYLPSGTLSMVPAEWYRMSGTSWVPAISSAEDWSRNEDALLSLGAEWQKQELISVDLSSSWTFIRTVPKISPWKHGLFWTQTLYCIRYILCICMYALNCRAPRQFSAWEASVGSEARLCLLVSHKVSPPETHIGLPPRGWPSRLSHPIVSADTVCTRRSSTARITLAA